MTNWKPRRHRYRICAFFVPLEGNRRRILTQYNNAVFNTVVIGLRCRLAYLSIKFTGHVHDTDRILPLAPVE